MTTPNAEHSDSGSKAAHRFASLSFMTAGLTYALIVFGGIVRITGSGMGCGDDWPLCNGQLIPPFDLPTLIEYGHRLAAALVSFFVVGVALYALRHRRRAGIAGRGIVGLALVSLILLVAQILVGAITVVLELPPSTVVLHLMVASTLLATLLVGGLRASPTVATHPVESSVGSTYPRLALFSAALGFLLVFLGGLVANTGAAPLCQGFPLCNGQLFPSGGGLIHVHWTHRLVAFVFLAVVALAVRATLRQRAPAAVVRWAVAALVLTIGQTVVAGALVLMHLPANLRALHLAVGVALWGTLVVWTHHAVPGRIGEPGLDAVPRTYRAGS